MNTASPTTATTQPPSSAECAYAELLDEIRANRSDNLALAVALTLHSQDLDPSCIHDLGPRLYDVLQNG